MLGIGKQLLIHQWHRSYYYCEESAKKSGTRNQIVTKIFGTGQPVMIVTVHQGWLYLLFDVVFPKLEYILCWELNVWYLRHKHIHISFNSVLNMSTCTLQIHLYTDPSVICFFLYRIVCENLLYRWNVWNLSKIKDN